MSSQLLDEACRTVGIQCPTCGASGQTDVECRRCRCDLRLLHRLEVQRAAEFKELAAALTECRWSDALTSAQYIHTLRPDDASFPVLAVCQLLNNNLQAAGGTYRQYLHTVPASVPHAAAMSAPPE
ncbi:MAG: hypothetical protein HY000_19860 [Planctomycetes bacterium]|nr:hypothetical protein [Planctomycetota bacterium]